MFLIVATYNSCEKKEEALPEVFGSVAGTVYNEFNQPLDGVTVTVTGNGINKKVSTANGLYEFKSLRVGRYELSVAQPNYIGLSSAINIPNEQTVIENFYLKSGEEYLTLSDTLAKAMPTLGFRELSIQSNSSWTIHTDADWLTISKAAGSGNSQVMVNWTENKTAESRTGLVKVFAGSIQKQFKVRQAAKLSIVAHAGIPGNGAKSVADSVYVRFNKKVKTIKVKPHLQTCISGINTTYTDNNSGVRFSYTCAELGGEYTFDLEVEDEDGLNSKHVLKAGFYSRKLEVPGNIVNYYVDELNKTYWVLTASPDAIYELAMSDLEVKRKFNIAFEPKGLALNHLTNELYVYQDSPILSVLNRTSGMLKRELTIPADPGDHSDHPTVYPYDFKITGNGLGVLLLKAKGSSALSWRMIDTQNNDYFYKHEQHSFFGEDAYDAFLQVEENHDRSKLLFSIPYGSAKVAILDQNTRRFTSYMPPEYTRGVFITPNRKDDRLYIAQLYNQNIVNLATGFSGRQSYVDNRENGSADFSYKANDANVIYFCDNEYLQVLNYDRVKTDTWYSVVYGLRGATATTDGKYLLAYNSQNWYYTRGNSYIVQFSTDIF
ncbi:carboxypeptidase regulatory-like domain-containing protein [Pontibacter ruber]|uniref:Carboxypeptidase regulatory-like domain-containing protein n=1 Tax=Pontibacter ruber TaxID=1343895 RepID=A0ABW5D2P1_9BACT|nr:carboxypeptidase regulatory-like domain-containing protein [Pontibacter ruber]